MQRITGLVALSLTVSLAGLTAVEWAQQEKAEQELVQMERDWCTAILKNDAALLGRLLAGDYSAIGIRGMATKASTLAAMKGTDTVVTTCVDDNVKVRAYGDAAVVTGHGRRAGTTKGVPFDREHLCTDTFVRRNDQWQCVASQSTVPVMESR